MATLDQVRAAPTSQSQLVSIMANKNKLQQLIDLGALPAQAIGLEIGPGYDPVMPKRDGHRVMTLDHLSASDLRLKYDGAPGVDVASIEEVDFVSDGGSFLSLIGKPSHFDYIVASHVIEHTVDLLGFLLDCQALLKPNGKLVLAVPDMRFSFDCLRALSTTGQVIDAHTQGSDRHSAGKVFDELAYNCQRNGAIAWNRKSTGQLQFFRSFAEARWIIEQYQSTSTYIDIHAWQFTPSSFRLLVHDLVGLGLLHLRELSFETSADNEFFMVLSQQAPGCPLDRMDMARKTRQEFSDIHA